MRVDISHKPNSPVLLIQTVHGYAQMPFNRGCQVLNWNIVHLIPEQNTLHFCTHFPKTYIKEW